MARARSHGAAKHGSRTAAYRSWTGAKNRCTNPRHEKYAYYGGRGIEMCERWTGAEGFARFLEDMGERPKGRSLDRINNDGHYEPGNCRWATAKQQVRNRSRRKESYDTPLRSTMRELKSKHDNETVLEMLTALNSFETLAR